MKSLQLTDAQTMVLELQDEIRRIQTPFKTEAWTTPKDALNGDAGAISQNATFGNGRFGERVRCDGCL